MFNLIDRYLLREWLKIFGLVLGATLGLLVMASLYDDLRDLLQNQATARDIGRYYLTKIPSFLAVVLPLALLVSLLYTLGRMHRNNETVALRAAGVDVFTFTRSLWLAGLGLCALTWYLNASVIPWSVEAARDLREEMAFRREAAAGRQDERVGLRYSVAFDNQRERRMWFFNRYSLYTEHGYGVTVVEMDTKRREKVRLLAQEAWLDHELGGWVFTDGREIWSDPESGDVIRTETFRWRVAKTYQEDPALMLIYDAKPADLSFNELERIITFFNEEENPKVLPYLVRYYSLLADTLGPLIILALAVPFAVGGVRVNPVVGVAKAILLFVLYFVLGKVATLLGVREVLPPLWAAVAPNALMLGTGLILLARVR